VIIALSLIHTLYSSLKHALNLLGWSSLVVAWQRLPTLYIPRSSASVLAGGACLITRLGVAWLESSIKSYSSCACGSKTALYNRRLKTVHLCPWPPSQSPGPRFLVCACRPIHSVRTLSQLNCLDRVRITLRLVANHFVLAPSLLGITTRVFIN
jgi:hypothetical protein